MEQTALPRFQALANPVRKKRTHTFRRRPQPTTPDLRPASSDDNSGPDNNNNNNNNNIPKRKVLSLSQCASKFPGASPYESETPAKIEVGIDDNEPGQSGSNKRRSKTTIRFKERMDPHKTMALNKKPEETSGPPSSQPALASGTENRVKKVTLKVGGVTRTIDANSSSKNSFASDTTTSRLKMSNKGVLDNDNSPQREKRIGLQGIPWKDFSSVGISLGREESSSAKRARKNGSGKSAEKPDSARKSRRVSKKRGGGLDDDDSDDEIRYLEKLKNPRLLSVFGDDDEDSTRNHRRFSKLSENSPQSLEGTFSGKDGKKRSPSEDTNFEQDEELISDGEPDSRKKKKVRRESADLPAEPRRELTLTSRQRALHSGKDASANGGSAVEFPNGLPPAPSRKQKEVLTEVEQQLKKAEAAQRRKVQNEKAARECEAEAIRKILGQDSSRKKKEDKKKKRVADLAEEKAADELMLASSTVRLIMGPNGTTVTFPNEMGLPSIFTSGPCSYPPARENCAGPSCSNPYKYRDSKTKVPLCSLQCYKAVQANAQSETAATC